MNEKPAAQAVAKKEPREMEYIPFGSDQKIKLSVQIVQNLICARTKSGKLCTDQDAIKFMMLCQARALNPFEGDAFLIGYDGKDGPQFSLITAHQAFLKRAECHPEYDGMESGVIVLCEDGNIKEREGDFHLESEVLIGGWAKVFFKTRSHPMVKRLRLSSFVKNFGVWLINPAGMIVKCAEADALRSSFPTKLGGLYLKEELNLPDDQASRFAAAKPALVNSETPNFLAPQPEPELKREKSALEKLMEADGISWTDLKSWAVETGQIEAQCQGVDDITQETQGKLVKAWPIAKPQIETFAKV